MSGMTRRGARLTPFSAALAGLLLLGASGAGPEAPAGQEAPAGRGDVRLEVAADRTSVTIGDPIALTVRLTYPRGTTVSAFNPERFIGDLTLLERRNSPPRTLPDGRVEEIWTLRVAMYKIGTNTLPAFEAGYADPSGKAGKAASAPIKLEVTSVLKGGETAPADIKGQAEMPERPLWPFFLAGLLLFAAVAWYLLRRRRPRPAETAAAPAGPPRPPHEIAYAELERLLSSGWLEAGRIKELYIELVEIIRRYLEGRYGVDTFERTTSEIIEALRLARVPVKATSMAAEFLGLCDLVKFAKYVPGTDETRATVALAYRLVDETRPAAPAPASNTDAAPAAAVGGSRR